MLKVAGAWALGPLVLGSVYVLWGWWGVALLALLVVLVLIGYAFYQFAVLDLQTVAHLTGVRSARSVYNDVLAGFPSMRDEEEDKRMERKRRLYHLETDIRHARELMRLEQEAQELRDEYAQRSAPYFHDVEKDLHDIFDKIEALKRGRSS